MPEYAVWSSMKARCSNPKNLQYRHYGGRGISVSPSFYKFLDFLAYVGRRGDGLSLDRINNDGNYEPGNVRWATKRQQMVNRSDNVFIEFEGENLTMTEWAARLGISNKTMWHRLRVSKMGVRAALTMPKLTTAEASQLGHKERWK